MCHHVIWCLLILWVHGRRESGSDNREGRPGLGLVTEQQVIVALRNGRYAEGKHRGENLKPLFYFYSSFLLYFCFSISLFSSLFPLDIGPLLFYFILFYWLHPMNLFYFICIHFNSTPTCHVIKLLMISWLEPTIPVCYFS